MFFAELDGGVRVEHEDVQAVSHSFMHEIIDGVDAEILDVNFSAKIPTIGKKVSGNSDYAVTNAFVVGGNERRIIGLSNGGTVCRYGAHSPPGHALDDEILLLHHAQQFSNLGFVVRKGVDKHKLLRVAGKLQSFQSTLRACLSQLKLVISGFVVFKLRFQCLVVLVLEVAQGGEDDDGFAEQQRAHASIRVQGPGLAGRASLKGLLGKKWPSQQMQGSDHQSGQGRYALMSYSGGHCQAAVSSILFVDITL